MSDFIVANNEMNEWFVYEQVAYAEYTPRRGPFPSQDQALDVLKEMEDEL